MRDAISALLQQINCRGREPWLVAIDGRCAAGKTTLARGLQEEIDCHVIHMDDFFLRPEQRTKERLLEPGGNVDYERVKEEVLLPLSRGRTFSYRPFDCRRMALSSPITVKPKGVTVVEGSYSCHPELWDFYDMRVFLNVEPEEQLRRIMQRNGEEAAAIFRERWIPLEERYFTACRIRERCDFLLKCI